MDVTANERCNDDAMDDDAGWQGNRRWNFGNQPVPVHVSTHSSLFCPISPNISFHSTAKPQTYPLRIADTLSINHITDVDSGIFHDQRT